MTSRKRCCERSRGDDARRSRFSGLVGVGIQPGPLKLLSAANHPLLRPEDFVGATVAIGPSTITSEALKTLGATTITIGSGGSIVGADAVEAQLQAIIGNHYESAMKHTGVNVVLFPRPVIYYANPAKFGSLSSKQQEALHLAVEQTAAAALGNLHQVEDAAFAALCANGSDMAVATVGGPRGPSRSRSARLRRAQPRRRDRVNHCCDRSDEGAMPARRSGPRMSRCSGHGHGTATHGTAIGRGNRAVVVGRFPRRDLRGDDLGRADAALVEALRDPGRGPDDMPMPRAASRSRTAS